MVPKVYVGLGVWGMSGLSDPPPPQRHPKSKRGVMAFGYYPRGSIYTTIMELGPPNHTQHGLVGPNSILTVYMDPLGIGFFCFTGSSYRYRTYLAVSEN